MRASRQIRKGRRVDIYLVRWIRARYAEGWTQGRLVKETDLSIGHIGRIVRGEVWIEEGMPAAEEDVRASLDRFQRGTEPEVEITPADIERLRQIESADPHTTDALERYLKRSKQ